MSGAKHGKSETPKKGLFSSTSGDGEHERESSAANSGANFSDSSDIQIHVASSADEDEVMNDYAATFNALHSEESGDIYEESHAHEMDHSDDDDVDVDVAFAEEEGWSRDDDDEDEDEDEDEDDNDNDIDIDDASETDGNDDEDSENGDDDDDDDDDEDEDEEMSNGLFGFMSGDRRGASFLRELMERNRSTNSNGGNLASQQNILEVMSRLVDGLEGPSFGRQHSEFDALVSNLSQRDDTYLILESINELSEKLLMMDGMTAERVIQPSQLARALVDILTDPSLAEDLELHLVTCRCLYNFIEVNTDFINDALNSEAVETLVAKLLDIVYIDLTEQCLQTLEIMSRDKGAHSLILASDGLKACLQNLDFLTVHSQRKCLQIVANACENISTVYFDFVLAQFQNLVTVAEHHDDAAVKKSAWLGVSRIIDSFKDKPDFLEKLFSNNELLRHMLAVIRDSCNPSSTDVGLNYHSMISLLKSLIILVSTSVKISNLFLDLRIGDYIMGSLSKFKNAEDAKQKAESEDTVSIESLISCPKELLSLFLHIIAYLSPITYTPKDTPFLQDDYKLNHTKSRINYERNSSYRNENAQKFISFRSRVWPVLIGSFQATMDYSIRKQALICLSRMVSFSDSESFGKREMDALFGILTSTVTSGKKVVSKAAEAPAPGERSLNGPILLLSSACSIIHNLLLKSQLSYAHVLEREGIFSDLAEITEKLEAAGIELSERDDVFRDERIGRISTVNALHEKFADRELIDLSQHMEVSSILKHLESIAISIRNLHDDFTKSADNYVPENDKLKPIVSALGKVVAEASTDSMVWDKTWRDLIKALSSGEGGISSFELTSSGLFGQLNAVFQGEVLSKQSYQVAKWTFVQSFYEDINSLKKLILLLQESLARAESFEVISSGVANSGGQDSGSASLAKQIKIALIPDDTNATDESTRKEKMIVSVHAIATFKTIQKFLNQNRLFSGFLRGEDPESGGASPKSSSEKSEDPADVAFSINGVRISKESTVFGAVFKSLRSKSGLKKVEGFDIWGRPHEIHYKYISRESDTTESVASASEEIEAELMDAHTESILNLLRVFFRINEEVEKSGKFPVLPADAFMNWKLTVKLNRQLEEPLIVASGSMPIWSIATANEYPFVFPLNTRMFFLQSTSFGHSRLIHNWNNRAIKDKAGSNTDNSPGSSGASLSLGAPVRKKVRLSRDKIFKGAIKVLQQFGSLPPILEIEYFDEVGSGLGPTLEFYASVSKAFCKKELSMWRQSDANNEYAVGGQGVFPAPLNKYGADSKIKSVLFLFNMLGVFVARALLDSRIIDFNFNSLFISLVQNPNCLDKFFSEDSDLSAQIELLREVDSDLARSLLHLSKYLNLFHGVPEDALVEIDGMRLSDLSLYFNLPGHEDLDLVPNGKNIEVTSSNLKVYIEKVVEYFLVEGVGKQISSFREGFSSVFPIESLSIFTAKELKEIFGSGEEDWSRETISESIKANHGFSQDSKAISMLVNVLEDLRLSERREFLQFLTGSPRLPIGGFKAMRPEFTVVRKHPEAGLSSDDYLPSVMTCANYLKLPDYTSESLMKTKLLHAMREGAGAFHLS